MQHLLVFYGEGCRGCKELATLLDRLMVEEGISVMMYEVWNDTDNEALLEQYDRYGCNGVPFLYNTTSQKIICGLPTYSELKQWAHGA